MSDSKKELEDTEKKGGRKIGQVAKTREEIIAALLESEGFISIASEKLNLSYEHLSRRIHKDRKLKKLLQAVREKHLDFAESKLLELVKIKNMKAIEFYLSRQGKHRGWVARTELTGAGGAPIGVKYYDFDTKSYPKPKDE